MRKCRLSKVNQNPITTFDRKIRSIGYFELRIFIYSTKYFKDLFCGIYLFVKNKKGYTERCLL